MEQNVFVKANKLTKTFGQVKANDAVDFDLLKGEIHAVLGENGAGKSTLMNMLSGLYKPDSGSIMIKNEEVSFNSPKDAIAKGIGMIHQHYKLVDVLSAKDNILIGKKGSFFLNKNKSYDSIKNIADQYGLPIHPNKKVSEMSIGEKQSVEIIKVLYSGADILILDEPTAVLTPQETKKLFEILRKMADNGCGIIIITHKLNEVMAISDRVTILRKGQTIDTVLTKETTPKELTDLMVGESTNLSIERPKVKRGEEILKVNNLVAKNKDQVEVLKNISFSMYQGEILGVAGIANSGQKELCESIAGLYEIESGEIRYHGENIVGHKPVDIIKSGISMSFIPEDRLGMGLAASMDMINNYLIKEHHNQDGMFLKRKPIEKKCEEMIERLDIQTPGIHHPVKELSGGNIQKVLIGREIDTHPSILVTAYAVRGLDINSAHRIYDLLNEQKKNNVAILFIGEDLDILLELCDRILVMCNGSITGIVKSNETTKEDLGYMMTGNMEREGIFYV